MRRAAVAIALLHAAAAGGARAAEADLVPWPANVQWREGAAFQLTSATPIVIAPGDPDAARAAPVLVERLKRSLDVDVAIERGEPRDGAIVLQREDAPRDEGNESYRLDASARRITLRARSLAGYAHAATTLWQLAGTQPSAGAAAIRPVAIDDAPRLRWRGLLLDSARHYQSPEFIERFIDTMAAQKLNVLHWHLTDDQGWRLEIRKYPRLTSVGAWRVPAGRAAHADIDPATGKPRLYGGYYTQAEARRLVAYAAARGVTIVPEIEMPGHASAVLAAYPRFATRLPAPAEVPADWGVYSNVLNLEAPTLAFLEEVLTEVMEIFPGPYIHIGGDEVDTSQWKASPRIAQRMRELGIADVPGIQHWLTHRMGRFLQAHGRRLVGWDEMLQPDLPRGAIVMSWRGAKGTIAAAAQGHDSVMAVDPDLYFDHRQSTALAEPPGRAAVVSLGDVYRFDPVPAQLEAAQRSHILGLQGNLWSEHIRTEARMGWMAFPRAAAIAELGWTPARSLDWDGFRRRMESMPARYQALGMTYAKTAFGDTGSPLSGPWRTSRELELCSAAVALSLEDDAPIAGPRAQFLVDILNPCWWLRGQKLDRSSRIQARVGQVPFNFQVGAEAAKIRFDAPTTGEGELVVHADTCDGDVVARLPLAPAASSDAVTTLGPVAIEPRPGTHDLCLRFAQHGLDPLWVLDAVRFGETRQ
ncbi:MAG TPA: beta-N-acetylhexosaminidase [Usitatibacter sp.]|jgi:hexosaminidase|nr:beta-N-acetylhexosaminidase [Usitatibacter sp.]